MYQHWDMQYIKVYIIIIINNINNNNKSYHGTVVECRTIDSEVPSASKKKISHVQSEQYHHQSFCTRVEYLKLSEVKTRSCHGVVVECRTRDPEVPCSNPSASKKKISHRSNLNNTTINPSAPELNT